MNETLKAKLLQKNLEALMRNRAFKFTDGFFLYTSGQIGPYFIQSIDITKDGSDYQSAINSLTSYALEVIGETQIEVISGGETRDWDFSNPVAYALGLPHTKLYKDKDSLGAEMNGKRVLHVADLNNEGSSVRDYWMPQIIKAGGKITDVLFYVDRLEDGADEMKRLGLNSHAIVPLNQDAWQYLLDNNHVTQDQYRSLAQRTEIGKENWAEMMLINKTNILKAYLENPTNRSKALKVLNVGYPHLKDELQDRLTKLGYTGGFN